MARRALPRVPVAQIDRMLKDPILHSNRFTEVCLIDRRMANAALVPDHFTVRAKVLAVMASETTLRIEMADIVSVGPPICLHLREEIRLVQTLHLDYRGFDRARPRHHKIRISAPVKGIEITSNGCDGLLARCVRAGKCLNGFALYER